MGIPITPTPKQAKLTKLLIENYGVKNSGKSLSEIIIEAGYSEASAHNPQLVITDEIREEVIREANEKK